TSMRRVLATWCARAQPSPSSRRETDRLFRLDVGGLDHLGPFLGIADKVLFELRRRAGERDAAEFADPRAERRIGEGGVDLLVEAVDDIGRRLFRRADTEPNRRIVTRQKFSDARQVGKYR